VAPQEAALAAVASSDPLSRDVANELRDARTEEAAIRAATVGADAMDDRLGIVWSRSGLAPACKRGCHYCCAQRVSVTVPELIRMVSYARATLSPDELAQVKARAESNAPQTHGTTLLGYPPRLHCAFLGVDGACRVYAARPLLCRREHAMDVAECKTGYELAAPGKDHPIVRLVPAKLESDTVFDAYQAGLAAAGVDGSTYELQEAAHVALSKEDAIDGWLEGQPTFATARLNLRLDKDQIPTPHAPRRFLPRA
jgi:Fe-S-cluster containining protein